MQYCIDANSFIEAKNIHYAMDFCPGFWDMIDKHTKSSIFSISQVYDELSAGNDELAEWTKDRKGSGLFVDTFDEPTQRVFQKIADYVIANYEIEHAEHFLKGADAWLIAKCKTMEATVVTKEVLAPGAKKVKIPNICNHFGVSFIQTYEMIREVNAKYILE
ncbi:DUF4411 family protein [Sulfurimonas sp.]